MRTTPTFLTLATMALAVALPVAAEHCETWSTTTEGDLGPLVEAEGHYVLLAYRFCDPQCDYAIRVYEESNGIAGLQRDEESYSDTCHGQIEGDTIIF